MALTAFQMVQRIKDRTHSNNDGKILGELRSATDWAFNRLFLVEHGPDQVSTQASELTISSRTREYDLGANVTGVIYGIQNLWLKLSADTVFTPMVYRELTDPDFVANDLYAASDSTTVATGHPVAYAVVNFAKVRFAPPLPSSCTVRADFWRRPPDIDPAANNVLVYGDDVPEPLLEPIVDKACAQMFINIDDDRVGYWEAQARDKLNMALYVIQKRRGPVTTQPFRRHRRRLA